LGCGRKARNPWIHPHPPICARKHLFCRRNQTAFDGRILSQSRRWKGIHRHTHLQEKSQMPRGILDRHGRVPWLTRVTPVVVSQSLALNVSGGRKNGKTFTAVAASLFTLILARSAPRKI